MEESQQGSVKEECLPEHKHYLKWFNMPPEDQ